MPETLHPRTEIHVCSDGYQLTGVVWTKAEFTDWLKSNYKIDFLGLSFRETLSTFFRIYLWKGQHRRAQTPQREYRDRVCQKSIDILVKLFDRYKDVEVFNGRLEEQKKKLAAYRDAREVPFRSGSRWRGRRNNDENVAQIRSLQIELDNLTA